MKKTIYNLTLVIISLFVCSESHAQKKLMAEYGESNGGGQFTPFDSTLYTYSAQNLVQTRLRRLYNPGGWEHFSKDDYTYNSSNELETQVYSSWTNSTWQPSYRYSYTYSGGLINEATEAKWKNGSWSNVYHELYTYNGNKIDTVFRHNVDSAGAETDYRKTVYTYTGTGKLAQILTLEWNNGNWEETVRWLYTYDGSDRLVKQEEEDMLSTGWYKVHYYSFSYGSDGLLKTHTDKVSSTNMDIGRVTYIYEGDPTNVSVNEIGNTIAVTAWPNPVQNKFNISWEADGIFSFTLMDINGKIINTVSGIYSNNVELNTGNMPSGLYLYRLESSDGNYFYNGKLIKE